MMRRRREYPCQRPKLPRRAFLQAGSLGFAGLAFPNCCEPKRRRALCRQAPDGISIRSASIQRSGLAQNLLDDAAMHVGQPEVAALKAVGQARVIDA